MSRKTRLGNRKRHSHSSKGHVKRRRRRKDNKPASSSGVIDLPVVQQANVDLGGAETVRSRDVDPDIVVLIATTDEFELIKDLVPASQLPSQVHGETAHCEYRSSHVTADGKTTYSLQVIVLGGQGELLASSVLMNTLYHRTSKPLLVASVGTSMSLSKDIKLGDVVFATSIDRYLERARVEDRWRAGEEEQDPSYFDFEFAGGGEIELGEDVRKLKHFPHHPIQHEVYAKWQEDCADDCREFMGEENFKKVSIDKMRPTPKHDVGFVLSGPLLVDSRVFKKKLIGLGRTALALDMESGGMVSCTKWIKSQWRPQLSLVVRGASDLGDGTKKRDDDGSLSAAETVDRAINLPANSFRRAAMRNAYRALFMICDSGWLNDRN